MFKRMARMEAAPPWGFLAALGALAAMFLTIVLGTALAQAVLGETESPSTIMTGWAIGAVLAISFVLVSRQRRSPQDAVALRLDQVPRTLPVLLLFSVGMAILYDLIGWLVAGDQTLAASELINFNRDQIDTFGWLIALIYMGGLQPAADELVLRGMLFPSLRSVLGPRTGILLCAGFHAAFHFAAFPPPGDDRAIALWFGFGLPLLDGLFFCGVRAHTQSTRAAIFAHAMVGIFRVLKVFALAG